MTGRTNSLLIAALGGVLSSLGCAHVPAGTVTTDRFDYAEAVADSWKRQTLMNVVRMRYSDAPVFLDLASIINTYTRSNAVNAGGTVAQSPAANSLSLGAAGTWTNSPTVTYQPVTGERFARQLLRPIPPASVFQMMEAGWPAKLIFPIAVRSVNGISGASFGRPADPDYDRLVDAFDRIQKSAAIGFRVTKGGEGEAVVMVISREELGEIRETAQTLRKLLGLKAGAQEFNVAFGSVPKGTSEIAMVTRSMMEIMLELGVGIDVPSAHREEGWVRAIPAEREAGKPAGPLVHIRSGKTAPPGAFAAIRYKDYAFWIDESDVDSKTHFTFLMILFSLAETGQPSAAPLVTISK